MCGENIWHAATANSAAVAATGAASEAAVQVAATHNMFRVGYG